jgi:DNA-binding NarL/FixJ family response regulator
MVPRKEKSRGVKSAKKGAASDARIGTPDGAGARPDPAVLIVDPDRFRREGMAAILRKRWPTMRCGFATSYGAVIDLLGKAKWDLALIELAIAGRGGLDLVSKVVNDWKTPTLLVSSEPEEIYGMRALRSGSAGYIRRDMPPDDIADAAAAVYAGGRYISEPLAHHLASLLDPDGNDAGAPFASLSDREFQVLRAIADGQCVKEIAASLSLSSKTVSTYRARILEKLGTRTDADLVKYCLDRRLIARLGDWGASAES